MFEKFSSRGRRIAVLAQEEARMLPHNYIGTEHLLLALLHEGGAAGLVIQRHGLSIENAREAVRITVGVANEVPSGHLVFTPRARKVLELGLREAIDLNHAVVEPEHLLLGLLRQGEGVAIEILDRYGYKVDRTRLRNDIVEGLLALPAGSLASKPDDLTIELRPKEKVMLHATNDGSPERDLMIARILEKRAREYRKRAKATRAQAYR